MTPDIVFEVRDSVVRSASAGSLNMTEADAGSTVDKIGIAMNLPVKVAGESYGYESSSSSSGSEYVVRLRRCSSGGFPVYGAL